MPQFNRKIQYSNRMECFTYSIQQDTYNTAIGKSNALRENQTGWNNTAIGGFALNNNLTGCQQ
jgi:hypothetical protein